MRTGSFLKEDMTDIERCPARSICPVAALCAADSHVQGDPLYPTIEEVEGGQLVWTDMRREQRVYVVQSGVLALIPNFDRDESVVTSLYGSGYSIGLSELYTQRSIAATYHLRALTDSALCSFPAKAFKRHLEALPGCGSHRILSCALTNIVEASCAQLRTVSKTSLQERVVLLLARLRNLSLRQGQELSEVRLTHEEIAELVASDRASVTRTLRKLKEDGTIELGYKTIRLTDAFKSYADSCPDMYANFQIPTA